VGKGVERDPVTYLGRKKCGPGSVGHRLKGKKGIAHEGNEGWGEGVPPSVEGEDLPGKRGSMRLLRHGEPREAGKKRGVQSGKGSKGDNALAKEWHEEKGIHVNGARFLNVARREKKKDGTTSA